MSEMVTDAALLELGNKIFALRKAHGLTQAQLAEKVGMSTSAINRIECGQRQPRLSTIRKFAECFNVDPNFLYEIQTSSSVSTTRKKSGLQTVPVLSRLPVSAKTAETDLPSGYLKLRLPKMKKCGFLFACRMPDETMQPHVCKEDLIIASAGCGARDGSLVIASGGSGQAGVYLYNKTTYGSQFSCYGDKESFVVNDSAPSPIVAEIIMIQRDLTGVRR